MQKNRLNTKKERKNGIGKDKNDLKLAESELILLK